VSAAPKLSPVREKPILFSGPMVRAILEGRKTQTRRTVKVVSGRGGVSLVHLPGAPGIYEHLDYDGAGLVHFQPERQAKPLRTPYGQPGDRLWVRETWAPVDQLADRVEREDPVCVGYRADYSAISHESDNVHQLDVTHWNWEHSSVRWRPSIFMPRWASRLTLEVTDVRVERLQDISEKDAKAEGVGFHVGGPVKAFETLWDSINGGRPWRCWDDNPWVWVVGFRRVQP
jgi:hypothetical protein